MKVGKALSGEAEVQPWVLEAEILLIKLPVRLCVIVSNSPKKTI